jgi:hypothetical protein
VTDGDLYPVSHGSLQPRRVVRSTCGTNASVTPALLLFVTLLLNSAKLTCHSCRLGKHVRLRFSAPTSILYSLMILVITFGHSLCVRNLKCLEFFAYVGTQFHSTYSCSAKLTMAGSWITSPCALSSLARPPWCRPSPYTSQQNGKAKRLLRTLTERQRARPCRFDSGRSALAPVLPAPTPVSRTAMNDSPQHCHLSDQPPAVSPHDPLSARLMIH